MLGRVAYLFMAYSVVESVRARGGQVKVAVNTIVPRSPIFCLLYPKMHTVINTK